MKDITPTLSSKALDILMPTPEMDTGFLAGFMRHLVKAVEEGTISDDWAWKAIHTFPSVPTKEAVQEQFSDLYADHPAPAW